MGYHQLTEGKRYQIEALLSLKKGVREIADAIGAHRSTIYRELRRNSLEVLNEPKPVYDASPAHMIAQERRKEACHTRRKVQGNVKSYVCKKLREGLSPEQISERLRIETSRSVVSYSSIYRYIAYDRDDFFGECLFKNLRRFILKRNRRAPRSNYAVRFQGKKRSLRERPIDCNQRLNVGHLERDLMEGVRGRRAVLVVVDRKTRYVSLEFAERNQHSVHHAMKKILRRSNVKVKTITNDNGHEFLHSRLPRMERELGAPVYFCDPYSPWQRGTVENTIGLIRQYLPRKMDLSEVTSKELKKIEERLNSRPKKVLKFRTPFEMQQQTHVVIGA